MNLTIRQETESDVQAIFDVTKLAFETHPFSSKTEQFIINQLRKNNVLTISLVAEIDQVVIGHIAFSPVVISSSAKGWYGLGPVSVHPDHQRAGIGSKLIIEGLHLLKSKNANGCVVLGEPEFYSRFGFKCEPSLRLNGVPPEYFMALKFSSSLPIGEVSYHDAFNTTND